MADDDQWRFSVDDFPDEGPGATASTTDAETGSVENEDGATEDTGGNVAGTLGGASADPEPGSPTPENAFFVLLGATATVVVFLVVSGII